MIDLLLCQKSRSIMTQILNSKTLKIPDLKYKSGIKSKLEIRS